MRIWSEKIHSCSGLALVVSAVLLTGACSSDVAAPGRRLSVILSQRPPVTIGGLTLPGTSAIVNATLQVSVTAENNTVAPVSFPTEGCNPVQLALYSSAKAPIIVPVTPVWQEPSPWCHLPPGYGTALAPTETLLSGQAQLFLGTYPIAQLVQAVIPGTYSVVAIIQPGSDAPRRVNAGTITIN